MGGRRIAQHGGWSGTWADRLQPGFQPDYGFGKTMSYLGLQQIVHRRLLESIDRVLVVGGNEHHMALTLGLASHLETGEFRHLDIQKCHVGVVLANRLQRLDAVLRHHHDVEFWSGLRQPPP